MLFFIVHYVLNIIFLLCKYIFCSIISLQYVHFVIELVNTYCTWHSESICHDHRLYIYHNHRNGIDFCPRHQKDYIQDMCICQIDSGNFDKWLEQVDEYHREHISILWLLFCLLYELPVRHDKIYMCIPYCNRESIKRKDYIRYCVNIVQNWLLTKKQNVILLFYCICYL